MKKFFQHSTKIKVKKTIIIIVFFMAIIAFIFWIYYSANNSTSAIEKITFNNSLGNLSGVNVSANSIREADLIDLKKTGASLVRVTFGNLKLINKSTYKYNLNAFRKLDSILSWCKKLEFKVIIDPHTFPGFSGDYSTLKDDLFWKDYKFHDIAIKLWSYMAKRYKNNSTIIGYDLLNEPYLPNGGEKNTPADLNMFYKKVIDEIRKYDKKHTIILEIPALHNGIFGYKKALYCSDYLQLPEDKNLVVSAHMYEPHDFTHQNVLERYKNTYSFPDYIKGVYWDEKKVLSEFENLIMFSEKNKISVYIGEFSTPRWTGKNGNRYLEVVMKFFDENNWSWTYHAYRESEVWDPERSNINRNDLKRYKNTERMKLLTKFFKENK